MGGAAAGRTELPEGAMAELSREGSGADLREAIPKFGKELLVSGEEEVFRQLFVKLFADYEYEEASVR